MFDLMGELEAAFLVNSLGLFRNRQDLGRATPRANVNLVRAYTASDFYRGIAGDADILHLIGHADRSRLQTGNGRSHVTAEEIEKRGTQGKLSIPRVVIASNCRFQSPAWRYALKATGARLLIASPNDVTPANLTAFDMAFYSALLSQVRRGSSTEERIEASFKLANRHYKAIHAAGTPFARFRMEKL
jgi:hypothetical protein